MSDDGEKTCPLCAEEMDLTDQQLKPCNCGYEICVWCWHHLMEMAEKDGTEGRCPACRTPYDKEKIVGTAGKCERVVAEHTIERKRSQKSKSKLSEGRKQLSSVRVIRRNLVYIVGLPLHLADEDLLQCREYFGQYGKVLKVSMSRTAAGVIQQFPNNTCSVYITYAKEEEAIRCIQSVNGFTLEGRPLRACFGTTKYCHAWLRNMPCSNPDCLYLHEVGSQEDSFTKDEVVSAYTRNRVQQITGAAINQQRCSGNVLPPPLDDYNSLTSTAKPIVKSMSNNLASARGSSPNGSSGRPIGLPPGASWAARASISQPPASTTACSNGPMKQTKASGAVALSAVVASTGQDPRSRNDASDETISNDKINSMYSSGKTDMSNSKQYVHSSPSMSSNEKPSALDGDPATAAINDQLLSPSSTESDQEISLPSNASNSVDLSAKSSASGSDYGSDHADGDVQYLCSDYSSMSMRNEYSGVVRDHSSLSEEALNVSEHQLQQSSDFECSRELPTLPVTKEASLPMSGLISVNQWDTGDSSQSEMLHKCPEVEEDVVEFNNQRLKDPEVVCPSSHLPNSSNILGQSNHSGSQPFQQYEGLGSFDFNEDPVFVNGTVADGSAMPFLGSIISNAPENTVLSSYCPASDRQPVSEHIELEKLIGMHQGNATSSNSNLPLDGENSIISNILSLDLDSLDDSLTSPQNLAQLLGETDGDSGPLSRILSSRKVQDNNLSRFSFARQEESKNQTLDADPLFSSFGQLSTGTTYNSNSFGYRDLFTEKSGVADGFSYNSLNESNNFSSIAVSSNNFPGPRAPISAPPGFSVPNHAPPPGFTSHERVEQAYDTAYGNQVRDASSMMRNSSLMPSGGIGNTNDLEFHDPAILKVVERGVQSGLNNSGIDMGSSYHQQCNNAFENEAKLQLLMQRSLSQHQNQRYSDINASYSLVNDPYGIPSRFLNQSQVNLSNPYGIPSRFVDQIQVNNMSPYGQPQLQQSNNSLMANGPWNEVQGGGPLSIADLLRHERLGYNKFYPSYEETKLCMPSSGDLYNRTFGL